MKALLNVLKRKLFLLIFVFSSTLIIATTVTISINNNENSTVASKTTAEQKKIAKNNFTLNTSINASKITTGLSLESAYTSEATVQTDKADYAPDEYVLITGSGWTPGEEVSINILSDCFCVDTTFSVFADLDGNITHNEFLITMDHIGAAFVLTATGLSSGSIAVTNFTDANSSLYSDAGRTILQDAYAWGSTVYGKVVKPIANKCFRVLVKDKDGNTMFTFDLPATSNSSASGPDRNFSFLVPDNNSGVWTVTVQEGSIAEAAAGACTAGTFTSPTSTTVKSFDVAQIVIIGAIHDAFAKQDDPTKQFGIGGDMPRLAVRSNPGANWRSFVQFDLSSIPVPSIITTAKLRLTMFDGPSSSRTYQAQRISAPWDESLMTWNNRLTATPWTTPGGDVAGSPVTVATGNVDNVLVRWLVTPDVHDFINGTNNYGWRIKDQDETAAPAIFSQFRSSEANTATDKTFGPVLLVDYSPCTPPLVTDDPDNVSVCAGDNTSFTVAASGTNLSYQWQVDDGGGYDDISDGGVYSNATTSILNITGATAGMTGYLYRVVVTGGCSPSATSLPATLTVKTLSVAPTLAQTSANDYCADAGGTLDLTASGGTMGTGAAVKWYSSSCGTGSVGTGNPLTIAKPTTTTTYYARYEGDCNMTDCASVQVNVKTLSTAPTGITRSANNVCPGTSVTLTRTGGSLGTGASWTWYAGGCGSGTSIGTGTSIVVNPQSTTTYYVRAEGECNNTGCANTTVTVKAQTEIGDEEINGEPGTSISYVYGCTSPTLSVVGSGPFNFVNLNSYRWYKNTTNSNSGGTLVDGPSLTSPNTFKVPAALGVGTHYFYATYTSVCTTVASEVFVITITQQEADAENDGKLYYNGTCMAWTPTATSNSATVTLAAFVKNKAGEQYTCGDIATATITFQVRNSSGVWTNIPSAQNLPVYYIDPNDPSKGGTANAIVQLNISNNTSTQIFDIRVVVGGNYKAKPDCGQAQITVSKLIPGGSISGGVLLCGPPASGLLKPAASLFTPSLLGFGVEYVMKGNKVQSPKGKVNLYVPSFYTYEGVNTFPYLNWYKISSNAIASLAITSPKAVFTGKANVAKYDPNTGAIIPVEGNCTMVLEIEDLNQSGIFNFHDKVGITIYRNNGGNWYSNNWVGSKTVPTNICGGDLTVTGSTATPPPISNTVTDLTMEQPAGTGKFDARIFPNPTEHQFTLFLENANNEKVRIAVYDAIGRKVKTFEKDHGNIPIRFGADLKVGMYIVEVQQGGNRKSMKLVKQ